MRPSLKRSLVVVAAGVLASVSCGREITGPEGASGRLARGIAIEPVWPELIQGGGAALRADFDRVRVRFLRSGGAVAVERTVTFPAGSDEITLSFDVPVAATAPATGEPMSLYLDFIDASDLPVFAGGPVPLLVVPSRFGDPPPEPLEVPLTYVGTGSNAASVQLSPGSAGITEGDPAFQFTAVAFDGQGAPIPGTPVLFTSTDTSVLAIGDDGIAVARPKRGTVQVIAKLYTGQADTASVTVALRASSIAAASGNGQTGVAGAMLAQSVVVRVLAADALPVPGVPVQFTAGSGGVPGAATELTDGDGYAGTTWTLGAPLGAQTMSASATGLVGSPVVFTATSVAGAPTELAITTQPSSVVAGAAIAPAVVVTARTAGGQTATGFAGPVTIALAANPGAAVLGGTLTVNAVAGIATFNDLTLDKVGAGYTLIATSGILTDATSAPFTVTPAAPAALTFVVPPVGGNPSTPLVPAPTVGGLDAFGNVTPLVAPVTIAIGANPGGATLTGTLTVAPSGGVAAFTDLELDAIGAGYTLVATATGLTSATSDPFAIGSLIISWTNASGGLWSVPANWSLGRVPDTVTLDASPSISTLVLGGASGTQTLAMSSRTLTVGGSVTVGPNGALLATNSTIAGPGAVLSEGTVTLVATTVGTVLSNAGTLVASGASALTGPFLTDAGSLLRVAQVDGSSSLAALTVANGFVNLGTIELSVVIALAYSTQLNVTTGTLVNAAGGVIRSLPGAAAGGTRQLNAPLDNQGLLDLQVPLTLTGTNAAHLNSGTIDVTTADLTVLQSAGTGSFTNTGTITLGSGRTLAVSNGAVTLQAGSLTGPGTLAMNSVTLGLGGAFDNAVTTLTLNNVTVNGPGTLTNATGRTLTLVASTVNAPLVNQGTLIASGASAITGSFTAPAGSLLQVGQVDGSTSLAALTVANGFVNEGTIDLTVTIALAYSTELTVTNGTLVNAPGGVIRALPGAAAGGTRQLSAQLDNQGLVEAQVTLSLSRASVDHVNSGTIDLTLGSLTFLQSGVTPSFTNNGTITVGAGRSIGVTGGEFTNAAIATLSGGGTFGMTTGSASFLGAVPALATISLNSVTATFASPLDAGAVNLSVTGSTISGPGLTIPLGEAQGLLATTLNMPVDVQGTLFASGTSAITGALTTGPTSVIEVGQLDGATSLANLTVANGFTNNGSLVLTTNFAAAYNAQITVTSGTLVNAGTILLEPGLAAGGSRIISAVLENQGTLTVQAPSFLSAPSADHLNVGTIELTAGDLTLNQSGTTPSFTNSGTIDVAAGRTFTVNTGAFTDQVDAIISGAGALVFSGASVAFNDQTPTGVTLTLANTSASFLSDIFTSSTTLFLSSATITGSGTLVNEAAETLTLNASTLNIPVLNQGILVVSGNSAIGGSLTTVAGSTVRIGQVDGASSLANLTLAGALTNEGAIELTVLVPTAYGAQLNVSSGGVVNAAGGTITTLNGLAGGGARAIIGAVDNQGTITVGQGTAGRLDVTGSLQNSGTIALEVGGTTPDTQFDRIVVAGTPGSLTLGGTLNVTLINAFTPSAGNTFGILTALARSGTFGTTNLPGGITSPPTYTGTGVTLTTP